jgi:hypothetical protein
MIVIRKDEYLSLSQRDTFSDVTGDWIETLGFEQAVFVVRWTAGGGTTGSVYLEGTDDIALAPVTLPTVYTQSNVNASAAGVLLIASAREGNQIPLPRFVSLKFVRSGGGAAGQLSAAFLGRQ